MKEHVLPFAQGITSRIRDSDRYFVIPQSEFATYFNLTPSNDPCVVKDYKIYSNISGDEPIEWHGDNQIKMMNTMGNYAVRIDKTIVTGAKVFYIGATTRGLNQVFQPIEITVCPNQGGSTVTPPVDSIEK